MIKTEITVLDVKTNDFEIQNNLYNAVCHQYFHLKL